MSSVSRATFNSYKSDLDACLASAVSEFADERKLGYDGLAVRAQCGWVEDASVDILMFGLDTFPMEDDGDDGETACSVPANDSAPWRPILLAASLALAFCISMWGIGAVDDVDAAGRGITASFVHDATLPVTLSSDLLPDAAA